MIQPITPTTSSVAWPTVPSSPAAPLDPTPFTTVLGAREPQPTAALATHGQGPDVGASNGPSQPDLPGTVTEGPPAVWSPTGAATSEAPATSAVVERGVLDYLRKRDDAPRGGASGLRWR